MCGFSPFWCACTFTSTLYFLFRIISVRNQIILHLLVIWAPPSTRGQQRKAIYISVCLLCVYYLYNELNSELNSVTSHNIKTIYLDFQLLTFGSRFSWYLIQPIISSPALPVRCKRPKIYKLTCDVIRTRKPAQNITEHKIPVFIINPNTFREVVLMFWLLCCTVTHEINVRFFLY